MFEFIYRRISIVLLMVSSLTLVSQTDQAWHGSRSAPALVDQARALPAEFRADTLLRIADSTLVIQETKKQELIEDAYWSGSRAFLPYMQRADGNSDSVATNAVRANRLEALTLQAKAVRAMLPISPQKALRLFEGMSPISLPKLTCSATSTPDVTDYYQTAVLVFGSSFTAKQRMQGDDIAFLRQLVSSVESPAQVPPALEMLLAVKITPSQRQDLLSFFGAALQEVFRSDREYGAAETSLASAIDSGGLQLSKANSFLLALRAYIVRHVSGRRCTDNMPAVGKVETSVEQFNKLVGKVKPPDDRFKEITEEEAKQSGDDGTYQQDLVGQSPQSQQIEDALRWLTHGNRIRNGQVVPWTSKERLSRDWLEHFDDASKLIHNLKESDEKSPEAFFCMKSDALNLLATLAPPGTTRDKAMEEYRSFLEDYYPSIQNPNLWFTMFRHVLYTARFSADPKNKAWNTK